jgi:hypothetical protein
MLLLMNAATLSARRAVNPSFVNFDVIHRAREADFPVRAVGATTLSHALVLLSEEVVQAFAGVFRPHFNLISVEGAMRCCTMPGVNIREKVFSAFLSGGEAFN